MKKNKAASELGKLSQEKYPLTPERASLLGKLSGIARKKKKETPQDLTTNAR